MKLHDKKLFLITSALLVGLIIQAKIRREEPHGKENIRSERLSPTAEARDSLMPNTLSSSKSDFIGDVRLSADKKSDEIRKSVRQIIAEDGAEAEVGGQLKGNFQTMLTATKTLQGRQVFETAVHELSRSPQAIALIQRTLTDQEYLIELFGKDQGLARVVGLKVLDQTCKNGEIDIAVYALKSLVSDFLATSVPVSGRTMDIENLTYSIVSTPNYRSLDELSDFILNKLDLDYVFTENVDKNRLTTLKTELYRAIISANLDKRRDPSFIQEIKKLLKIGIPA